MIAIIADDITGAAEVAGVCLRQGVRVAFRMDTPGLESLRSIQADVLVLVTDTRSGKQEAACNVNEMLAVALMSAGVKQVFKKIDSVLRGYVLDELSVVAEIYGKQKVFVQPANPAEGRCIRNGVYYIENHPIAETPFHWDPDFPADHSEVRSLLEERSRAREMWPDYVLPDASRVEDLEESVRQCTADFLPAGSAAFWDVYLRAQIKAGNIFSYGQDREENLAMDLSDSLMICGSSHRNSADFAEKMRSNAFPVWNVPEELCGIQTASDTAMVSFGNACVDTWKEQKCLMLRLDTMNNPNAADAETLKWRMAELVAYVLMQIRPREIFIEGGTTAFAILRRMGWMSFLPVREWKPGVVQLQLESPDFPPCRVTLKPGSYLWPPVQSGSSLSSR